jgi:hypothetical protein
VAERAHHQVSRNQKLEIGGRQGAFRAFCPHYSATSI